MTSDALLILQSIFSTVWGIFTSWHIPGTRVTPAMFFIFLILADVVWSWFRSFFSSMPSTSRVVDNTVKGFKLYQLKLGSSK